MLLKTGGKGKSSFRKHYDQQRKDKIHLKCAENREKVQERRKGERKIKVGFKKPKLAIKSAGSCGKFFGTKKKNSQEFLQTVFIDILNNSSPQKQKTKSKRTQTFTTILNNFWDITFFFIKKKSFKFFQTAHFWGTCQVQVKISLESNNLLGFSWS